MKRCCERRGRSEPRIYRKASAESSERDGRKRTKEKLDEHAMIVSDKILSKEVEADQLKVTLHYTVIENIAEPQPISESDIQGD